MGMWKYVNCFSMKLSVQSCRSLKLIPMAARSKRTRTLERVGRTRRVGIFLLRKHIASDFRLRADGVQFIAGL